MDTGPTVRQRRLAAELRRLREASSLTPEQAAGALGWSRPKLVRIETATQIPKVADVEAILAAYGGNNQAIKLALLNLAREIRQRGWWAAYGDVLTGGYAELEHAASHIRSWQLQLVPGLLQTPEYARAIISTAVTDPTVLDRRVQARMTRRTLLDRATPPRLDVLLAEEVLRRPAGEPSVLRGQLGALLAAADRPHVSIRIVPLAAGLYPSVGQGSMVLFEFDSAVDLSVAYMETIAGGMYVEDHAQVQLCTLMFDRIAESALSEADSAALIRTTMRET